MKTPRFFMTCFIGTHAHFNILFYTIDCLLLYCTSVISKLECTVPPVFAITSRLPMPVSWNACKGNLRFCLLTITPVRIDTLQNLEGIILMLSLSSVFSWDRNIVFLCST
jgi:hypothetical protein